MTERQLADGVPIPLDALAEMRTCEACGKRFFRDLIWGVCPTSTTGEHALIDGDE